MKSKRLVYSDPDIAPCECLYCEGYPLEEGLPEYCVKETVRALQMAHQVSGELCDKCGWAMKFPFEQCRCELAREVAVLRGLLADVAGFLEPHTKDVPGASTFVTKIQLRLDG